MKKIGVMFLLFIFQYTFTGNIQAGPWEDYQKANAAGDKKNALKFIEKAYKKSPGSDYLIYNYGFTLFGIAKYQEAIKILKKLPKSYSPLIVNYYVAEGYNKTGQIDAAIELLKQSVTLKDDKYQNKKHLYFISAKIGQKVKDAKFLDAIQDGALEYFSENPDKNFDWFKYTIRKTFTNYALDLMAKSDEFRQTVHYLNKSIELAKGGLGDYQQYVNINDLYVYQAAARFWSKHRLKSQQSLVHTIQIVIVPNLDSKWKDKNGTVRRTISSLPANSLQVLNPILTQLKKIYFYYSKGHLLLDFKIKSTEGTISKIVYTNWSTFAESYEIYTPDFASTLPHPGKFLLSQINNFDSLLWVYSSKDVWHGGTGGIGTVNFIPYLLDSTVRRGKITLTGDLMDLHLVTLVHEFYHVVQSAYYHKNAPDVIKMSHVYKKGYRKLWPSWYSGEGEFLFYQKVFEKVILPQGMEKLKFRTKQDKTASDEYKQNLGNLKKTAIDQLALAHKYKIDADNYWVKKDKKKAKELYLKSFKINPKRKTIGAQLGRISFEEKKYDQSIAYFESELANNQNPEHWVITYLAWASEKKGDIRKALKHFQQAYHEFQDADSLYHIGRLYYAQKNYQKASLAFEEHLSKFPRNRIMPYTVNFLSYIYCYYNIDFPKAIQLIEKHLESVKNEKLRSDLAYHLGYAYGESGQHQTAVKWLLKSKKLYEKRSIQPLVKRYQ